jgi:signal transduction histidine kinase
MVVAGTTRDAATTISVADQGTGISAANQERIFEPFTQLSSGPTRSHEGVGLGLPISRMLAELMGGSLDVASEPGRGSTFLVQLPGPVVLDDARKPA